MNWKAISFDWNQVRAFLATMDEGSLSAAARVLNQTQPTVGRQVAALEAELRVTLFERVGRQLVPTAAAEDMARHVRDMGDAAMRLSLVASGQSQSVEGRVTITASEMYSVSVLPDFIAGLRETAPGIQIEIVSTNSLSDLRRREADIAVRNTQPTDPDLIAKKVRTESGGLFATPDFIRRHGPFDSAADLAGVPFIGMGQGAALLEALQKRQIPVTPASFVAGSESHVVHWALAERGIGIGLNGWHVGRKSDRVVPVLNKSIDFEFPVWLVAPQELRTSRRVRVVYDTLSEFLKKWPEEETVREGGKSA